MNKQSGFTLIELMIVVAIIGILAAIALPAYSNYTKKAKVSEVMLAASAGRTEVSEYVSNKLACPASNIMATQKSKFVSAASNSGCVITATAQGISTDVNGKKITLTGTADTTAGTVDWACTSSIPAQYLPSSCK